MIYLQPIPEVESSFVTHWLEDPHARMSYSYVPVGCSGALYETLAEPVKNKLYFAGEVSSGGQASCSVVLHLAVQRLSEVSFQQLCHSICRRWVALWPPHSLSLSANPQLGPLP